MFCVDILSLYIINLADASLFMN